MAYTIFSNDDNVEIENKSTTEAGVISYNEKTYYANGVTANINLNYTGTIPDGYKAIFTYLLVELNS